MSDRRRLITKAETTGVITTIRDWEDGTTIRSVRDSWVVTPGAAKPTWAESQRRWGGARQTGETTGNGEISWMMTVKGSTADACITAVEAMLGDLAGLAVAQRDLFVEWRPDGATNSVYYEIRGPAQWTTDYKWAQFAGAQSMVFTVKIPVAPLAEGAAIDLTLSFATSPLTVALGTTIPGDAPAKAAVTLVTAASAGPPAFALFGWSKRPSAPLASSFVPFGVLDAAATMGADPVDPSFTSTADALYRSGTGLKYTTSGVGLASALLPVDPSTLLSDDFAPGEVTVEMWARIQLASTVVSPRITLSLMPFTAGFGQTQYSAEFGGGGRLLTAPTALAFRFVKLGSLNLPVDASQPLKYNVKVQASWGTGSSGVFGLDYLVLVPARQRALSPTAKPNDVNYPKFIQTTSLTTKIIRSDLSGGVASGAGNFSRDSGLGGSLIEFPPGNVDFVIKLSSLVPDDPTASAASEFIGHVISGGIRVTPRYWLAR
jgi:hypothetical protein